MYWLNSHDPDFEAKAYDICQLYLQALRFYQEGRLVICADEKTGMQILQPRFKGLWQRMANFSVTTVVSKAYET